MRKISTFLLMVVPCLNVSIAGAQGLALGVKGGLNRSTANIDATLAIDANRRNGALVAGVFAVDLHPLFGFQAEVQYSQKGFQVDEASTEPGLDLAYLEFPVLALLMAPIGDPATVIFRFFGGGSIAFELSCNAESTTGTVDCADAGVQTASVDLGFLSGAGVEFVLGRRGPSVVLDGTFDIGLKDINETPTSSASIKNSVFSLTAALMFPLGSRF